VLPIDPRIDGVSSSLTEPTVTAAHRDGGGDRSRGSDAVVDGPGTEVDPDVSALVGFRVHARSASMATARLTSPTLTERRLQRPARRMPEETLMDYDDVLVDDDGSVYFARACGKVREDGLWEGWLEFESTTRDMVWRTERETTQPNRVDLLYWASGVSPVYLEGAFARATEPPPRVSVHFGGRHVPRH